MIGKLNAKDKATATVDMKTIATGVMTFSGMWKMDCFDKNNNLKWSELNKNMIVDEGLNHILNVQFHNETQVHPWYVLLKGAGAVLAADDLTSQANWTEFTDYSGDRQEYVEGLSSSESMANSAAAVFPITGAGTVAGAGLASVNTGTGGVLFAAVDFGSSRTVANGDTINVTYTITSADVV